MSGAMSPEAETIIRQQEMINRLMGESAGRINAVQRSLDAAWAAQERFERTQNAINAAMERGRITQERGNQLLALARQRYQQAGQAAQQFAAVNDNVTRGVRASGQTITQAGFQIQDFFVQVQGGTSALTALSQQGSQFLGVFGPGGAIAGAVLAVGALAAGLLLGRTEAERFREAMERNRESYERATQAAERFRDGLAREAQQAIDLRRYYASLNQERQSYEIRQASRTAIEVEARRTALERDILGRLPGLSSGFSGQIYEAEAQAARNYGRGSAEFEAIASNETLQRMRQAVEVIEAFRAAGDVSENAIAAFAARLREASGVGGAAGRLLAQTAREMENLGQRARDVERDQREVNATLQALGVIAAGSAGQVAGLTAEMARLQAQSEAAVRNIGTENTLALQRAQERAEAIRRGVDAAAQYDAEQRNRDNANRYYDEQTRRDEARMRAARMGEQQIRDEIARTATTRRETADALARQQSQNDAELERRRQAAAAATRGAASARREERLDDRVERQRDRLISSLGEEEAATIRLQRSLDTLRDARARDIITQAEADRLRANVISRHNEEIARMRDKSELDAEQSKRVMELTNDLGSIMRDTWNAAVREGQSFSDVLRSLEQQLLKLGDKYLLQPLLDQLAQLAVYQLGGGAGGFGGGGGGILGMAASILGGSGGAEIMGTGMAKGAEAIIGAVLHDGGVAGHDGDRRLLPAEVFLDAPRYHSGGVAGRVPFASDEIPAVLRRRELVLTEPQQNAVAARMAGRSIVQNVTVKTDDPGAFARTRNQMAGQMRRDLARAARNA